MLLVTVEITEVIRGFIEKAGVIQYSFMTGGIAISHPEKPHVLPILHRGERVISESHWKKFGQIAPAPIPVHPESLQKLLDMKLEDFPIPKQLMFGNQFFELKDGKINELDPKTVKIPEKQNRTILKDNGIHRYPIGE